MGLSLYLRIRYTEHALTDSLRLLVAIPFSSPGPYIWLAGAFRPDSGAYGVTAADCGDRLASSSQGVEPCRPQTRP